MANSIPASQLVQVQPGVLGTGGTPLSLNAVFLTKTRTIPVGTVQPFPTLASVQAFFGPNSQEAADAAIYFLGFDNSHIKPASLLFSQFVDVAVSAYLRGGTFGLTLAQVQAIQNSVNTASIATTTMTVTVASSGTVTPGMLLTGTGVTAGTRVVAQLTGTTGGVGTYSVSISQTVSSTTITGAYDLTVAIDGSNATFATVNLSSATSFSSAAALLTTALSASVTYNSQLQAFQITSATTGVNSTLAFATGLAATTFNFTSATGGILSQGSAVTTPAAAMDIIANVTQNWGTFMTLWEPVLADKIKFAVWVNGTNDRYAYIAWDSDVTAVQSGNTTSFGPVAAAAAYDGVVPVYNSDAIAAFICGAIASIDFTQLNGRITLAFKGQSGLAANVTDATTATNLIANGYNFIGSYATAATQFTFLQAGSTVGKWKWVDSYVNQIFLNSQLQLALLTLLSSTNALPYNDQGYGLVRAACTDPIAQALNFGSIRTGVPLSAQQAAQVNAAAGLPIAQILTNSGFYLQILPASTQIRGLRQSPPITLWYMDGGSIQRINMASIDVL